MTDRRTELEAAIDDDPYDPRAYAVLADHLQELGDPRGELIAMQLGGRTAALEHSAGEALAKLGDAGTPPPGVEFRWAFGYARSAVIDPGTAAGTRATLAHPSCRFLAELRIRHNNAPLAGSIKAIASAARPCLRVLHLGQETFGDEGRRREVGDLAELWATAPRLQHLEIHGVGLQLGAIDAPHLQSFKLDTAALDTDTAAAIARARWPALQRLTLMCGSPDPAACRRLGDLVARADLPALEQLTIHRLEGGDRLLEILASSPLVKRLRILDLERNDVSDTGAHTMITHRDAFAQIGQLGLPYNDLSPDGRASLEAAFPGIDAEHRNDPYGDDDDEHYDDVDE